jgi:peptidoglycan glycosyltransferase
MNTAILRLFGLVTVLFAVLVAFTSRWTVFEADALRANNLNRRQRLEEQRIPRGTIKAADGTVLARSRVVGTGADKTYTRVYPDPQARAFAHAIGYSFTRVGRAGLEQSRNDDLTGATNGVETFFDQLTGKKRVGRDVITLLDPKVQQAALNGLAGRKGAVVALDPRTGAVKAMASVPGYDPGEVNLPGKLRALNLDRNAPIFNRSTQASYAPGSTFKVVTAIAALDSGKFNPNSTVDGKNGIKISGVPLSNFGGEQFGVIDLTTALTHSVNTVWAQVAEKVGKPQMAATMEKLGFDRLPPLDYPADQRRASGEYKGGKVLSPRSRFVDVGRMGIGQDKLQVTPLQMAMVAAAVANGGKLMRPHLTDRVVDRDGRTTTRVAPRQYSQAMSAKTAQQVGQMMSNVVKEGTGTAAALSGIDVAGKTGTAEVGSCPGGSEVSFIAFAPVVNPRAAVAVTLECVPGQAGTFAAPVAKQVLEAMLA